MWAAGAVLADTTVLAGWRGEAVWAAIGFAAGLALLTIPKIRNAKSWQRLLTGGAAAVAVYFVLSLLMGYFFHEQLG
ncbi:MAG: hypothetical protein SW019_02080 [Actinomycetota bacterium]|nr:hypothetical protein [Actinomycetota bacterium]